MKTDDKLNREIESFRRDMGKLEENLDQSQLSPDDMAKMRRQAQEIVSQLNGQEVPEPEPPSNDTLMLVRRISETTRFFRKEIQESGYTGLFDSGSGPEWDLLQDCRHSLESEILLSDISDVPDEAVRSVALNGLILEAREIVAFQRLTKENADDSSLEQLILNAASIRIRISHGVARIKTSGEEPSFKDPTVTPPENTLTAIRLSCRFIGELEQQMGWRLHRKDFEEARILKRLKMRLTREYSGLWLMIHPCQSEFG
ncbi:MAG TPA: hypothetical protein EYQ50_25520 [Verrucomicrobiales bacterium]|nr:hypothetical protein [Verrucomicrobiales bacterium]HIL70689.1 hypothetical protein [Verrucomicrobiota bacterium]